VYIVMYTFVYIMMLHTIKFIIILHKFYMITGVLVLMILNGLHSMDYLIYKLNIEKRIMTHTVYLNKERIE
jgi:hypothetical protein